MNTFEYLVLTTSLAVVVAGFRALFRAVRYSRALTVRRFDDLD